MHIGMFTSSKSYFQFLCRYCLVQDSNLQLCITCTFDIMWCIYIYICIRIYIYITHIGTRIQNSCSRLHQSVFPIKACWVAVVPGLGSAFYFASLLGFPEAMGRAPDFWWHLGAAVICHFLKNLIGPQKRWIWKKRWICQTIQSSCLQPMRGCKRQLSIWELTHENIGYPLCILQFNSTWTTG